MISMRLTGYRPTEKGDFSGMTRKQKIAEQPDRMECIKKELRQPRTDAIIVLILG